ncbi:hypothetical protein ADIMK_0639 [Marinobacterium lacunae]|uniref:Uncharacterized protein n=1 Tax=Marinobacterium lacunae TaxID=1232683 RepID=A0A081G2D2_9GAMM|nr:hypothetical protein ADIMK_0639 [Marinobacterium lacunae]
MLASDSTGNSFALEIERAGKAYRQAWEEPVASSEQPLEESEVETRLAAIKAKPNMERTAAETEYLIEHDTRMAEIAAKDINQRTADEIDYMQKAGGFVNTMSKLSPKERALYDELVAAGDTKAVEAMNRIAMTRYAFEGTITLPNGARFDPDLTEISVQNIEKFFRHCFDDPGGEIGRSFDALAAALDRRVSTRETV